jgi:hypothetical protein
MGRGDFRERTRESQKKKKDRDERKKRATELTILRESQRYKSGDPMSKRRERHLKSKLNIGDKPQTNKDHLGRDSEVGAKNRKSVRQNPASDETLKTVKEKLKAEKLKAEKLKKAKNLKIQSAKKAQEAGKQEREEHEWGPGGQPSASKQFEIQAKNKELSGKRKPVIVLLDDLEHSLPKSYGIYKRSIVSGNLIVKKVN